MSFGSTCACWEDSLLAQLLSTLMYVQGVEPALCGNSFKAAPVVSDAALWPLLGVAKELPICVATSGDGVDHGIIFATAGRFVYYVH